MVRPVLVRSAALAAVLLGFAAPVMGQPGPGLTGRVMRLWTPLCDTPEARAANVQVRFTIGTNGRLTAGPEWLDPPLELLARAPEIAARTAAFERAKSAVSRGAPYTGLDSGLYNVPIILTFDAQTACNAP